MTCGEVEDYASQHNMTLESFLDMVCDCIVDMDDQEVSDLAEKHGIDSTKAADSIKNIIEKYLAHSSTKH
jgi:hypothetical protein